MTDEAMRALLAEGEVIREPQNWTLRPGEPAYCVEVGAPVEGQSFNAFAEGWGETPDTALNALWWKLVERSVSGRILWPFGLDRWPTKPTPEDVEKQRHRYEVTMTPDRFARYAALLTGGLSHDR